MKNLLIFLLLPILCNAQVNIDSLWGIWNDENNTDSNRLSAMHQISWDGYLFTKPDSAFYFAQLELDFATEKELKKNMAAALNTQGVSFALRSDYDKAIIYYTQSLNIQEEIGDKSGIANALNNIGIIYKRQGDYDTAIEYYTKSLKIRKESDLLDEQPGGKKQIAKTLNNIGHIYKRKGDYAKAIDYYAQSLSIREEIGDKKGIASAIGAIGLIYKHQGDLDKAIEYCNRSLVIGEEIKDISGIANSLNSLGLINNEQGNYAQAIEYHTKSLIIEEGRGNKSSIAISLHNIASNYNDQGETDKAMEYYKKSLSIREEIGDKSGIAHSLTNIGNIYYEQNQHAKALNYGKRSLAIAQSIGATRAVKNAAQLLWKVYKRSNKFAEGLNMHELYIASRDSLNSEENQKAIIQQEYKHAYEKQASEDNIKAIEADKVKDALLVAEKAENKQHTLEAEQQQLQKYFLYGGLALTLLFGGFIFNRFRATTKQKIIIEEQKQKVDEAFDGLEEAHKEITDSITYAERIQRSFLATDEILKEHLNEYFVYFNPKEAVSGDFYWAGQLSNGHFAIVNADSTGHGVPGAIMSILNVSSIEKAIEKGLTTPPDIFNDTRTTIIERLKKDGSEHGGKDGMDASLISFNSDKTKMTYVAAQNPIWIIRNGELTEVKPEKMPVGKHDYDHIPFIGGEYDIKKGDQIYTLTDGFQDQFGGPKGKKFMVKKMREYVLSISTLPMEEQLQKISDTFTAWKGEVEQIDDVCVIGVKI
jgi:tetratricopeptide (TPR) repeat protein/serine phosphatase RsbU (regulator of sigma subunit)